MCNVSGPRPSSDMRKCTFFGLGVKFHDMIKIPLLMLLHSLSHALAQSFPQGLSGMGLLMCGMRGQLWAHDEHDEEGMHFLSNATTGTSFEKQVLVGTKCQSVDNKHDSEADRITVDLHHETAPSRSLLVRWHNSRQLLTGGRAEPASSLHFWRVPPCCWRMWVLSTPEPLETKHWFCPLVTLKYWQTWFSVSVKTHCELHIRDKLEQNMNDLRSSTFNTSLCMAH